MKKQSIRLFRSTTVLPVALKYENEAFGRDWLFQQDGVRSQSRHLTQQNGVETIFHHLLTRIHGQRIVPI